MSATLGFSKWRCDNLPSITPAYLYTFIALIAVGGLLIFSFMAYTDVLRSSSEIKQLKNLMDYVAGESIELLTLTSTMNATAETFLQMPASIGNRQYWLQLCNDSSSMWLDGGFGDAPTGATELRVYVPKEISATGYYVGGYGAVRLKCYVSSGVPYIQLANSVEGD